MRPIVYINFKRVIDNNLSNDDIIDLIDFVTSYTIHHGMIKGKIETMIWVIDAKDVGLWDSPYSVFLALHKRLKLTQIVRGANTIVVNLNPIL